MPQNPPYIPSPDGLAADWSDNFSALITANPGDYGLIAGDAVAIAAATDPYRAALTVATEPTTRTPVAVAAKDAARATMEAVARPYAVQISADASISGALKTGVGVTNRITTKTRNAVAGIQGNGISSLLGGNLIRFECRNPATPLSKKRPLGAVGWELQVQQQDAESSSIWEDALHLVVTRPEFVWDKGSAAAPAWRFRVRWVGKLLEGGAENVGPWDAWADLPVPS